MQRPKVTIDYFKELCALMSYAHEHTLSTNLANYRKMLFDQKSKGKSTTDINY